LLRPVGPRVVPLCRRFDSSGICRQRWIAPPQCTFSSLTMQARNPNPEMVDARQAPSDFDASSAVVYRDFISEEEEEILTRDIQARFKRYVVVCPSSYSKQFF